jgi:hypothetical protein
MVRSIVRKSVSRSRPVSRICPRPSATKLDPPLVRPVQGPCVISPTRSTPTKRESDLGPSARGGGAVIEAGYRCFATDGARLLASRTGATRPPEDLFAELEDVCPQSRPVHRRLRFPGRSDRPVPNSLRVPPDGSRDTAHRALQHHRASNGGLVLTTTSRSDPKRSLLSFPDPGP